jgi:hypothetical protein
MKKIQQKNIILKILKERTNNILFKIEHLIHLTKKGKKIKFDFCVSLDYFYVHDKKVDICK